MDNKQLIASDLTKKEKAVAAQRRYRLRLKAGTAGKEGSETTYETYKKSNADYMRDYRKEKKNLLRLKHMQRKIPLNLNQQLKRKFKMWKRKSLSQNSVEVGEKVSKCIYPSKQYNPFSNLKSKNKLYQNGKIHFHQILQKLTK